MECREFSLLALDWENGQPLENSAFKAALQHIARCADCQKKFPVFASFAPRDLQRDQQPTPSAAAQALADRVMANVGSPVTVKPVRRSTRPRPFRVGATGFGSRAGRRVAFGAVAACLLVASSLFFRQPDLVEVRFVLDAPQATSVFLAGDFSAWETKGLELSKTKSGTWERKVKLKRGQTYSYNFIIDGTTWIADPAAPERVDDGFGGESALIRL